MKTLTLDDKLDIIEQYDANPEQILNILVDLQFAAPEGYITQENAQLVAKLLHVSETRVYEIIRFYSILKDKPQARFVLKVCDSAPCHFSGGQMVMCTLTEILGVAENETTNDGMFMFHGIPCIGACDETPLIKIKDTVFPNLTPEKIEQLIYDLRNHCYAAL